MTTTVQDLIGSHGRVHKNELLWKLAKDMTEEAFCEFFPCPALVGSALFQGKMTIQRGDMEMTQLFRPEMNKETLSLHMLEWAVFPFIRTVRSVSPPGVLSIGRQGDNDIVMDDQTISGYHAKIIKRVDGFFLRDNDSTNGTLLNGKKMGQEPEKINANDKVTFGRYEFTVLTRKTLYAKLRNEG